MRARDNPFRSECILRIRYRLGEITWPELLGRWKDLGYRGALVGPRGSGKTTLLEDLAPALRERGFIPRFICLDFDHRSFRRGFISDLVGQLTSSDVLLFDGAEQLSSIGWMWFKWQVRHVRGLIITTHHPGRLPTLLECRTSASLLAQIAAELLAKEPEELQHQATVLFTRHRGNLRDALRHWYDIIAVDQHRRQRRRVRPLVS